MIAGAMGFILMAAKVIKPADSGPGVAGSTTSLALGAIFLLAYYLSKRLLIQVETAGGRFIGVRFKPSLLGQLTVDLAAASDAVHIINTLIARGSGTEASASRAGSRNA
jgi:hypothetical protein